jgi:hypothetical protein
VERAGGATYALSVGAGGPGGEGVSMAEAPALEMTVPLALVDAAAGDSVWLRVVLDEDGRGRETVPAKGALTLTVPASE